MFDKYTKTFLIIAVIFVLSLIYVPVDYMGGRVDAVIWYSDGHQLIFDLDTMQRVSVVRLGLQILVASACCFVVYLFRNTIDEIDSKQKGFEDDPE